MKKYLFQKMYVWYVNDLYKHWTEQHYETREFVKKIIKSRFFEKEYNLFKVNI